MDGEEAEPKDDIERNSLGSEPPDPGAAVASRKSRTLIFAASVLGVQAFMSYDSGATAASLATIIKTNPESWTPTSLALLGAMDKIATAMASPIWGRLLQKYNTKFLLVVGLALNAACTLFFGILVSKYAMFGMKFAMGATQALQNIWGSVWVVVMAPPDTVTLWMALQGVSAAIGNGVGTAVAGFGTANGLPYSFAYILQAGILGAFWCALLLTPHRHLVMRLSSSEAADEASKPSDKLSTFKQLRLLWENKVYVWTIAAVCLNQFQVTSFQYFFVLIFGSVWGLSQNYTTIMVLLVPGIGLGIGISFGPAYIDRQGGFKTAAGMARSLLILKRICTLVVVGSLFGMLAIYLKFRGLDTVDFSDYGDVWLYLVWISMLVLFAGHAACVAAIQGINTEAVEDSLRSFASGIETSVRNFLGYFAGTFLPGVVMDLWAAAAGWNTIEPGPQQHWAYCVGLAFIFMSGVPATLVMWQAVKAARELLQRDQGLALTSLRMALQEQDLVKLKAALKLAKTAELQKTKGGQAVIGMAYEILGAGSFARVDSSKLATEDAAYAQLLRRNSELERRKTELETEVVTLRAEVADLRARFAPDSNVRNNAVEDDKASL